MEHTSRAERRVTSWPLIGRIFRLSSGNIDRNGDVVDESELALELRRRLRLRVVESWLLEGRP